MLPFAKRATTVVAALAAQPNAAKLRYSISQGELHHDLEAGDISAQYDPCIDPASAAYSLGHMGRTEEHFDAFLQSLTDEIRTMLASVDTEQALRTIADALAAGKIEKAA